MYSSEDKLYLFYNTVFVLFVSMASDADFLKIISVNIAAATTLNRTLI